MDIALEIGILEAGLGLREDGRVASRLHNAALVKGQGAEITVAKTPPVGRQTELDLGERRNPAVLLIGGMISPHERQCVDVVHLLGRQGLGRRILHDKELSVIGFIEPLGLERIGVLMLDGKAVGVGALVRLHLLKVRQADRIVDALLVAGLVNGSVDIGDVANVEAGRQRVGNLGNAVLAHAIGNQVGAGVKQNRAADLVGPVVVVTEPSKTGLNPADDDRRMLVSPADQVAVDDDGVVRALADDAAGRVGVLVAALLGHRIVVDHGVHVAGGNQKAEPRLAILLYTRVVAPVGLADQRNAVAAGLQQAANDCGAKARMVHVRVAADIDKVGLRDAVREKFCSGKW